MHLLPFIDMARHRGARLVVIDVWRTRTARRADWFIPIRVGTDTALALGIAHVLHREGLLDRHYIERLVLGYDRWAQEVLPRYAPDAVEGLPGFRRAMLKSWRWPMDARGHRSSAWAGVVASRWGGYSDTGHCLSPRPHRSLAAPWRWGAAGHGR